jgi:spore coat polysaccharide biosynthesis protein SpsF
VPKVGIVSQARMTSTRLPGKVLKQIQGHSLLEYHLNRLAWSGLPVIVATTVNKTDDPIVEFCEKKAIPTFRGNENDVLSRYYGAAEKFNLDVLVRVTSDCPLIDGKLIRQAVDQYQALGNRWMYMSNCLERTYPRGFDFEVFTFEMLKSAFERATTVPQREHVTPYFYQKIDSRTELKSLTRGSNLSQFRLTVDEPDDFKLMEKLIVDHGCALKTEAEIGEILQKHPELGQINAHIEQKKL